MEKKAFNLRESIAETREQYEMTYKTLSKIVSEFNDISMLFEKDDFDDGKIDKRELEDAMEKAKKITEKVRGFKVDMDGLADICKKLKIWLPKKSSIRSGKMNKDKIAKELVKIAKALINDKVKVGSNFIDELEDAVKSADNFMSVGRELRKRNIKVDFSTEMLPMYMIEKAGKKYAIIHRDYVSSADRYVGDIAIGEM